MPSTPSMLVIPGVELTQNLQSCEPPPEPGRWCPLHVNALFVTPPPDGAIPWSPEAGIDRIGRYRRALGATRALGGIAQLNHPNFDYSADAPLVSQLAREGLTLMEVANQAWDSSNDPKDGRHPSTEAIWDAVLSAGADVFGTATDDAHHFDDAAAARARDEQVFVGDLGFVMVRARKEPGAIRQALARGDFYSSTGVVLKRIDRSHGDAGDRGVGPRPGRPSVRLHRNGWDACSRGPRGGAPPFVSRTPRAATCAPWSPTARAARPGSNLFAFPSAAPGGTRHSVPKYSRSRRVPWRRARHRRNVIISAALSRSRGRIATRSCR